MKVRLTTSARNYSPVWSPDGRQLLFTRIGGRTATSSVANMVIAPITGGENAPAISPSNANQNPTDWSRDGKFILFEKGDPGAAELWATEASIGSTPFSVLKSQTRARDGRFSPDGKWVAYGADESGQYEVYLTAFPGPGPRLQISSGGGEGPRWREDGREIYFYSRAGAMMAVSIAMAGSEARVGNPRKLFQATIESNTFSSPAYDVTPDGKKFIINSTGDSGVTQSPLNLVVNWGGLLKPF